MSTILTREDVQRAERREGYEQHPTVRFLHDYACMDRTYEFIETDQIEKIKIDRFRTLGSLTEQAMPFDLGPLELVAIWSKLEEVPRDFDNFRYSFAGALVVAYSVYEMDSLKGTTGIYCETRMPNLSPDQARHIDGRLEHIRQSHDQISSYVSGADKDHMTLAIELAKRSRDGDPTADQEFEQLKARVAEYQTPLLAALGENLGNGMHEISSHVGRFLK